MIPSHDVWMRGTDAGKFALRSKELEALDKAILAFHEKRVPLARERVREAFQKWKNVHIPLQAGVEGRRRNANGLLRALELEFAETAPSLPGAAAGISRIRIDWPRNGSKRPPGAANVSERMIKDRIDKGLVEAQLVLRSAVDSLVRGDSATRKLVRRWFGSAAELDVVRGKYEALQARLDQYREAGAVRLELRWPTQAGGSEIAAGGLNSNWMVLGAMFFNDRYVVPASSLNGRPGGDQPTMREVTRIGALYGPAKEKQAVHERVKRCLDNAGAATTLARAAENAFAIDIAGDLQPSVHSTVDDLKRSFAVNGFALEGTVAAAATLLDPALRKARQDVRALKAQFEALGSAKKCSVSGALIHELTHMVLATSDLPSPTLAGGLCNGELLCQDLAAQPGSAALRNADNFRLFVESLQT